MHVVNRKGEHQDEFDTPDGLHHPVDKLAPADWDRA
jgi:hypothetical protein